MTMCHVKRVQDVCNNSFEVLGPFKVLDAGGHTLVGGWPARVLLIGWAAEPKVRKGFSGFRWRWRRFWNPIDVVNEIDSSVVFHNLASTLKLNVPLEMCFVSKVSWFVNDK